MKSNRVVSALAASVASALVLAGCGSGDEVRLAEPELDFPYTSVTTTPSFSLNLDGLDDEDEDEDENAEAEATEETESTTSETETSESESESSTSSTTRKSSSSRRTRTVVTTREPDTNSRREAEPVALPGSACAWPSESAANGGEFATFCDREWARTVLGGQQYFWTSKGGGWVSIDPIAEQADGVCWNRDSFNGAPEAIRNAVVYCS